MPKISVKLPEKMYQQLLLTTQEFELENISAAVRLLLQAALETQNLPTPKALTDKLQKKTAHYSIMAYCLMDKFLTISVKNGQVLSDEAHDAAEKLINNLTSRG
jgi:Arc/MetJ-type ribon-helix-helix transcriptional regulator